MIPFAIVLSAVVLFVQWRQTGSVGPKDFTVCGAYIGVTIALVLFARAAFREDFFTACAFVGLVTVFLWHRREVRAGRREPVWFGKG